VIVVLGYLFPECMQRVRHTFERSQRSLNCAYLGLPPLVDVSTNGVLAKALPVPVGLGILSLRYRSLAPAAQRLGSPLFQRIGT
jgi:hypothetical protein